MIPSVSERANPKLPPHDEIAEKSIIGCCITEPMRCLDDIQLAITGDHFYTIQCRMAWEAICDMQPDTIDAVSFSQKIKDFPFAIECQNLVGSVANFPYWLEILCEKFTLRKIIEVATGALESVYGGLLKPGSILDDFERKALAIRSQRTESHTIRELVTQAIEIIEKKYNNATSISGFSTGLYDLDRITDGIHGGELIVLAAYPSCGKSALMVNVAHFNAMAGIAAGILSAEMRPVQLVVRTLCAASRANFRRLEQNGLTRMVVEAGKIAASKMLIEPAQSMTIGQIKAAARRMKQKHGIQILGVDYIQLLEGTGDNRERQVASVSAGLKAIALELNVAVIALSQLNDDGKLRESRAIGQDADSVWILSNKGDSQSENQPVTLNVNKCRDGETGTIDLMFLKQFTKFESCTYDSQ